jgi:hypothetical protein
MISSWKSTHEPDGQSAGAYAAVAFNLDIACFDFCLHASMMHVKDDSTKTSESYGSLSPYEQKVQTPHNAPNKQA